MRMHTAKKATVSSLQVTVSALAIAIATATGVNAQSVTVTGTVSPTLTPNPSPTWTVPNSLYVGNGTAGTLAIANGGTVAITPGYNAVIGYFGGDGLMTVDGVGSRFTAGYLYIGYKATGTLRITNGGNVVANSIELGHVPVPTSGNITIDGAGSALTTTYLYVGEDGPSSVTATGGGRLTTNGQTYIGLGSGVTGTVTISGAGSTWNASTGPHVGERGNGVITISDQGHMITSQLYLGYQSGSRGDVQLNSSGVLTALQIQRVNGGSLSFDGGIFQLANSQPSLFSGFVPGTILFQSQGGTIDTQSFDVGTQAVMGGVGGLTKTGSGTLTLRGNNNYTGATTVSAGTLYIMGDQTAATGTTTVQAGATLGGTGIIGGDVAIQDNGQLSPGPAGSTPGTLTINGDLNLSAGSSLQYSFGKANTVGGALNDHTIVKGDLVLDGTINVVTTPGGSFDTGVYRVISYDGALTNNILDIGTIPASNYYVQTSVDKQVNLVNTSGLTLNFWDVGPQFNGQVNGGTGIWQSSASGGLNTNWAEQTGVINAPYQDGAIAIFMATAGTVTVDDSLGAVTASGMQFASDGYVVEGDAIGLVGSPTSTIRVGDGTEAGAAFTATINSALTGNTQLVKSDLGTLVLNGANTYTGGTAIQGGIVQVSNNSNLGAAGGGVTLDDGTLRTTASFTIDRATELQGLGGTFETLAGTELNYASTITGAGSLTKTGLGTLNINAQSNYSGVTTVNEGILAAGGENYLSGASDFEVAAGAKLALNDFSQSISSLSNAGIVDFGPQAGTRLTVTEDYVGNGGTLALWTALGGDSSATDSLLVNGNTSGTGIVAVKNANGTGAQTVEGIKVIDIQGASGATFTLLGEYQTLDGKQAVRGGAYAYTLEKNGISTPTDGDWYLRSRFIPPLQIPNPETPGVPQEPDAPRYQAGVPVYEAYPQSLLALNGVSTLQQRVGNRVWAGNGNKVIAQGADAIETPYAAPEEAGVHIEGNGVWGRVEGAHNHVETGRSTTDVDYDQNIFKLQAGVDGMFMENESGKLIGGVSVHYAHGLTKTASIYDTSVGGGRISTEGYGLGGSLTWYGESGFYVDAQAQATWYNSDLSFSGGNQSLVDGNDGFGYALSIESGKRFALDPAWSLTPQAQLVYSSVDFDDFSEDMTGTAIHLSKGDSLQGRIGLTLDHESSWQNANGMLNRAHVYGIANLYYEFLEGTKVEVADVSFANRNDRAWGGVGLGGSYNWNDDKYSIYGEGLINTSLNNFADSYSLKGNVGFRMKW